MRPYPKGKIDFVKGCYTKVKLYSLALDSGEKRAAVNKKNQDRGDRF